MDNRRQQYAAPPPPPSTVDARAPPPFPSYPHHQQPQTSVAPQAPVHHQQYSGAPPPPLPGAGPALPPIQHPSYGPPGSTQDQQSLPSFRHPPQHPYDPRDGQDYQQYNQHNRSGHATPAPVNRSYSHDSGAHQHTPTTPAQAGPYPSVSAQDAAPPPHQMDHGAHHGYPPTNGVPHGLPPPGPPPPPHHEQHPQYMTPMMENHHAPYPPSQQQPMYAQHGYQGPVSASQFQIQRKKQMRATQACEQCRQRKQKCDEGSPCSFCKENSLSCQYRDTPPAKTDKNMEKLLGYMEQHTSGLTELASKFDNFDARLRRLEHGNPQAVQAPVNQPPSLEETAERKSELDDHRTAPHKLLLLWPSVKPLLSKADVQLNEGYVMEAEDRGILRLYTRGEGIDEYDGTQPGGPASPARSEESGHEGNTPAPPEGLWGVGFPQTPSSDIRRSEPYSWGGLKPDNSLDLDVNTINTLYDSYIRSIHIMHPFLDKQRLRKLFDLFIKRYSTGQPKFRTPFAVAQSNSDSERPLKRQRSNGSTSATMASGPEGNGFRSQHTERSPGNAVVYLVLALGKICMHREALPAVVPDNRLNANSVITHQLSGTIVGSSPISASIKPSPISPNQTPATQPTPPAEGGHAFQSRSRRSSMDGLPVGGVRNLDVIPGIAYYAKAAEIMGDQGDGNDLVHAQMFLLAGLYKGQLARVKESMSWFSMAGRAILILLDRYKLYNDDWWSAYSDVQKQFEKGQARIKDRRHSLIVLASWTCLQLETDILAELRLPSSGVQNIEHLLIWPPKVPHDESYGGLDPNAKKDDYGNIMYFYTAQMFLRKRLNQVHREMYGPDCLNQPHDQVREVLKGHESILEAWRKSLPDGLRWEDSDSPATDILAARLRAKYWGARYVVNRPFLDYALHIMPLASDGMKVQDVAKDVHGNPRDKAEIHLFEAIEGMGQSEIFQASKRCIDAAMQSTVALDAVPDRLVVTNIHGTAHAQFGNMLVLSATYSNRYLKHLVPPERFQELLDRTISFLRRLSPISPTCNIDCSILEKIHRQLFGLPQDAKHFYRNEGIEPTSATNSFSAST